VQCTQLFAVDPGQLQLEFDVFLSCLTTKTCFCIKAQQLEQTRRTRD